METVIKFISENNTIPVALVIIGAITAISFLQSHYIIISKMADIRQASKGKIGKFVDDTLIEIEEISFDRGRSIMEDRWAEMSMCVHGDTELTCEYLREYFPSQIDKFHGILHDSLSKTKQSIIHHIDINGFHDLVGADLEAYYTRVGEELFEYNKRMMRIRGIDTIPLIKGTHGSRFTKREAVKCYEKIVSYALLVKKEEIKEIETIRKKLQIGRKLSELVGRFVDG